MGHVADKTLVTNNRVVKIPIMAEPVALALTVLSALIVIVSCEYSASECRSLGFNKANLLCSSCFYLTEHDLEVLVSQCRECCLQEGRNDSSTLYPKAILEVCG